MLSFKTSAISQGKKSFPVQVHVFYILLDICIDSGSIVHPSGNRGEVFVLHLWFLSRMLHGAGLVQRVLRRRRRRLWCLAGLGQHQRLGPQGRGFELHSHAGCYHRLEGAHSVAGGASAAADGWLSVGNGPQHGSVDGAEGLAGAGRCGTPSASAGGLPLLQGVQHHVRGVLG